MRLALAIIAKDEYDNINRIIKDYEKYFDEIGIAIDDKKMFDLLTEEYASNEKVNFFKYEWISDFSDKRNFLAEQINCDYYVRMDTDDELENPAALVAHAQIASRDNLGIVYTLYDYSKDEYGNVNAQHWRDTIIKKDPNLFWNKKIHENILPKTTQGHKIDFCHTAKIIHLMDDNHTARSYERNVKYLIAEYEEDKEKTDPRTLAYLGRMLFALGQDVEATYFLEKHIEKSGWDEDRYASWCQLSEINRRKADYETAIACAFEAIQEVPAYPEAYFKLHDVYQEQQSWDKAIYWAKEGFKKPIPQTFTLIDPSAYTWRPALSLSFCFFKKGEYEAANRFFDIAKKAAPNLSFIKSEEKYYRMGLEHTRYIKNLGEMVNFLKEKDRYKIKDLLESIPAELADHEYVSSLKNKYLEPKTWADNDVAILCGDAPEEWSPNSVKGGIGGSEEAVIRMGQELTKLGHKVTVYNNCGMEEGDHDGVQYTNWYKINLRDNFNRFICWRNNIFGMGLKVKQKIVWLHDCPNIELTAETAKTFDKIVVLSDYHRTMIPACVPDEKVFVSTNGINPGDFDGLEDVVRDPKRVIYASSYNRGLEEILLMWPDIKKAEPEAKLEIFYGWDVYDEMVQKRVVDDNGWKDKMLELFKQDGVTEHGRVGHKQLCVEYAKSGVFAYQCKYEGEIQCMAYTKALAAGCYPVTNNFGVFKERNLLSVPNDKFKETLIAALENSTSTLLDRDSFIHDHAWARVAEGWSERLFKQDVEVVLKNRMD